MPAHRAEGCGRLGDRRWPLAGFRDEYYGLAAVVREATPAELAAPPPWPPAITASPPGGGVGRGESGAEEAGRPLITVGAIDWAGTAWGRRAVRFGQAAVGGPDGRRRAPRPGRHRGARLGRPHGPPKLLVATQTRVVELAVDEGGGGCPRSP